MTELTELTIRQALDGTTSGAISSTDLVDATLRRIAETEPMVRAYVAVFEESARDAAQRADEAQARGDQLGPLHGIPVSIKDVFYTDGTPTEAGSKVLRGYIAPYESTVVRRLRDAGAVIVGKVVTHEFAYGRDEPPTRHPLNSEYYPGGSSGGSAVSVATRSAFGSIGTDAGGSVRLPSTINGIVGLKPTYGRVSKHGVVPITSSLDHVGQLARTVEDCAILLQVCAGFDPDDPTSIDEPVPDYLSDLGAGVHGLRLGIDRGYFFYEQVSDDVRTKVEEGLAELEGLGATLVEVEIPELERMTPVLFTILLAEASMYHRYLLRRSGPDYDPRVRVMFELGEFVSAPQYLLAQRERGVLNESMRQTFRDHRLDALVGPALPLPSVPMDELFGPIMLETGETPLSVYLHHTFPADLTGQPALTVPCGFAENGFPIGIQVIGRPFDESRVFQIARAYESQHAWFSHRPEPAAATTP